MAYPTVAWEKAMDVQAVILKALSGEIHWFRAADILGMHPRSLRRWRERYEQHDLTDDIARFERGRDVWQRGRQFLPQAILQRVDPAAGSRP